MIWVYVWLAITAGALITEFLTADMVSIWFAGGGIVALSLALFDIAWYIHLPVFIVLSLVLLLTFRKLVMKKLIKGDTKTNADAVIGLEFTLLTDIGFNQMGTIKVNGVVWNVNTEDEKEEVSAGSIVKVLKIQGNKYIVEKV